MTTPLRLLFVCTGNLHRSPMAEAFTRRMFEELNMPVEVTSAGTLGLIGVKAPDEVIAVCREMDIDLESHHSKPLSRSLIGSADLVVVMEDGHGDAVLGLDPSAEDKLVFLGDYCEPSGDVPDPIGCDLNGFRDSRDTILSALQGLLPDMVRRSRFTMQ